MQAKNDYTPRTRYLAEREFPELLLQLRPHRRWWVIVAVFAGGRRSVIERLNWTDVDLGEGWLHIPGTKTARSDRMLPLMPALQTYPEAVPVGERMGPLVRPERLRPRVRVGQRQA